MILLLESLAVVGPANAERSTTDGDAIQMGPYSRKSIGTHGDEKKARFALPSRVAARLARTAEICTRTASSCRSVDNATSELGSCRVS